MSSEVETSLDDSIQRFLDSARNDKEALAFGFRHSFAAYKGTCIAVPSLLIFTRLRHLSFVIHASMSVTHRA